MGSFLSGVAEAYSSAVYTTIRSIYGVWYQNRLLIRKTYISCINANDIVEPKIYSMVKYIIAILLPLHGGYRVEFIKLSSKMDYGYRNYLYISQRFCSCAVVP